MTFSKFLPVALMVGIVAALYVVLARYAGVTALWVPFVSSALFFAMGAKIHRLPKEIVGVTGGIVTAVLLLMALQPTTEMLGEFWALPVLVFIAGTVIVLLELTDLFELASAYFFGFAGYFAFLFGSGKVPGIEMSLANAVEFWVLLMAGFVLGLVLHVLREFILNWEGVPVEQRATVFDKEGMLNK